MMGTRREAGSRTFTLLVTVIDTCCQRGHLPWPHLAGVISERRAGRPAARPAPVGSALNIVRSTGMETVDLRGLELIQRSPIDLAESA